jgi:hypothetical protein
MPSPTIPTPQDAGLLMQDTTTKTAVYQTPGLDLGSGFVPGGLGKPAAAIVHVTALDLADGNETYSVVLQESSDNVTFTVAGASLAVTAVGVAAVKGWLTKRYVRLSFTIVGTTPSITFKAWLNPLP